MNGENCNAGNVSASTQKTGGLFAILSLACTLIVFLVLVIQCALISAEAPLLAVRLLKILRIIFSVAGVVTGVIALTKKNMLGIAGIVAAVLGYLLLPTLVLSLYFRFFHR